MSKKKEYIKQWIKSHPQIRIYLNKEEYEKIKQFAEKNKLSFKEILLKGISDEYKRGYDAAITDVIFGTVPESYLKERGLKYTSPCPTCGKRAIVLDIPKL
jgi:hypothetical protein